jgi:hypothetical protein
MSAGAVFKLIANDGKADRMIMATALLNQRIADITCQRKRLGKADTSPTLVDLERTHILFVNAHFKPFAAIGYEYNKVKPQSGNPALGNAITFSIPQFGDFFHDMVGFQMLSATQSQLQQTPEQAGADTAIAAGGFPANDRDWDSATELEDATYSLVDVFGNPVAPGDVNGFRNLVRYCEYPGERLYQNVKFDVNGNPLDEYNDTTVNMLRKFTITTDKLVGYKRLVGQEVCLEGYSGPMIGQVLDSRNDGQAPSTITFAPLSVGTTAHDLTDDNHANIHQPTPTPASTSAAGFIANHFPDNAWNLVPPTQANRPPIGVQSVIRDCLYAYDGPQTPKYQQPQLGIWNKLRFWFNDDARLSIASVSIPFGQRFITIELAAQNLLLFEFPGLYVRQEYITSTDANNLETEISAIQGGLLIVGGAGADGPIATVRQVTYRPYISASTISDVTLSNVELYVNNIFVNPEVHDIYIKRIGFSLIRVYRQHKSRTSEASSGEVLLSQLKWPIEYMFVALRPTWNINSANPQQWRDWHRMSKPVDITNNRFDYAEVEAGDVLHVSRIGKIVPDTWVKELRTVDTISLTAHGISIHDRFPTKFFNAYTPFHYGGPAIVTPSDEGALFINYCLYPKSYQPSGHLNTSRARELYLAWTTSYVDSNNPAEIIAVAIAINFLLITDGSAVLRYST